MKTIYIDRKSICMADDIDNHSASINVSDNCSYLGLLDAITKVQYLPVYDTMWLMCSKTRGFIAAYYRSAYNNFQWIF